MSAAAQAIESFDSFPGFLLVIRWRLLLLNSHPAAILLLHIILYIYRHLQSIHSHGQRLPRPLFSRLDNLYLRFEIRIDLCCKTRVMRSTSRNPRKLLPVNSDYNKVEYVRKKKQNMFSVHIRIILLWTLKRDGQKWTDPGLRRFEKSSKPSVLRLTNSSNCIRYNYCKVVSVIFLKIATQQIQPISIN